MNLLDCSSLCVTVECADGPLLTITHFIIALCLFSGWSFLLFCCLLQQCSSQSPTHPLHSSKGVNHCFGDQRLVLFESTFVFDCSCPAIKTCCINSNPLNWTGSPGLHTLLHNGEKWRNRETVNILDQVLSLRFVFCLCLFQTVQGLGLQSLCPKFPYRCQLGQCCHANYSLVSG